jgi:hypothetical protein
VCSIAADDALTALEAALDAVAAEGSPFDDSGRLERVRRLTAAANRITALQAHAVRDAEVHQAAEHDGLKTMKSWLRTHARLSGAAITGLIKQGRAMAHLPAVEAAFLTGRLTPDQVDTIAVITAPEHLAARSPSRSTWPLSRTPSSTSPPASRTRSCAPRSGTT